MGKRVKLHSRVLIREMIHVIRLKLKTSGGGSITV